MHCEATEGWHDAKEGWHDTLQFYFPNIAADKRDLTTLSFVFTNFNNPWSARDFTTISVRMFADKECYGGEFTDFEVSGQTILPGDIPNENCSVTSSFEPLGFTGAGNTLKFEFRPATTLSRTGNGLIRLHLPRWYEGGSNNNFMYNVEAVNACSSN